MFLKLYCFKIWTKAFSRIRQRTSFHNIFLYYKTHKRQSGGECFHISRARNATRTNEHQAARAPFWCNKKNTNANHNIKFFAFSPFVQLVSLFIMSPAYPFSFGADVDGRCGLFGPLHSAATPYRTRDSIPIIIVAYFYRFDDECMV